jgi:hypothetical protein
LFWLKPWVKSYQFRQKSYDLIVVNVVKTAEPPSDEIEEMRARGLKHGGR